MMLRNRSQLAVSAVLVSVIISLTSGVPIFNHETLMLTTGGPYSACFEVTIPPGSSGGELVMLAFRVAGGGASGPEITFVPSNSGCDVNAEGATVMYSSGSSAVGSYANLPSGTHSFLVDCPSCNPSAELAVSSVYSCPRTSRGFQNSYSCLACADVETASSLFVGLSDDDCECGFGTLRDDEGECIGCPEGADCFLPGDDPPPLPGYYRAENSTSYLVCNPQDACPGGAVGEGSCGAGYDGDVCGVCADNYHRTHDLTCAECGSGAAGMPLGIALFAGLFAGFFVLARIYHWSGTAVLLAEYAQITALFALMNVQWPAFMEGLFVFLSIANVDPGLAAPECSYEIESAFMFRWAWAVSLPLTMAIVGLAFAVPFAIYVLVIKYAGERCDYVNYPSMKAYFRSLGHHLVAWTAFTNIPALAGAFSYFACQGQADGSSTLFAEPALVCGEGLHGERYGLAVFALLMHLIVVPAAIYFILKSKNKADKLRDYRTKAVYGPWYERFDPDKWYWEPVRMVLKSLLVASLVMGSTFTTLQATAAILALMAAFLAQLIFKPYLFGIVNQVSLAMSSAQIVMLGCGLLYSSAQLGGSGGVLVVTLIAFVVGLGASALAFVSEVPWAYTNRTQKSRSFMSMEEHEREARLAALQEKKEQAAIKAEERKAVNAVKAEEKAAKKETKKEEKARKAEEAAALKAQKKAEKEAELAIKKEEMARKKEEDAERAAEEKARKDAERAAKKKEKEAAAAVARAEKEARDLAAKAEKDARKAAEKEEAARKAAEAQALKKSEPKALKGAPVPGSSKKGKKKGGSNRKTKKMPEPKGGLKYSDVEAMANTDDYKVHVPGGGVDWNDPSMAELYRPATVVGGVWEKYEDETGTPYYFNVATGERSWDPPEDA